MMTFEDWLEANGFDPAAMTKHQRGMLHPLFDFQGQPRIDLEGPFADEHAARLKDPDLFDRKTYRRVTNGMLFGKIKVPKTIDVLWAKLKGRAGKKDMPLAASLRFPTSSWTVAKAKAWLKRNAVRYLRFEPARKAAQSSVADTPAAIAREARLAAAQKIAAGQAELPIQADADAVSITADAAAAEGDLPRITIVAYSGIAMNLRCWLHPVVIDLAGMKISKRSRPILHEHDRRAVVGHTDKIENGTKGLIVSGLASGTGPAAREVTGAAANGFPWRASVGVQATKMTFIEAGKVASANGKEFKGPTYIARKSILGEVSIVALAADDDTSATVAAGAANTQQGEHA